MADENLDRENLNIENDGVAEETGAGPDEDGVMAEKSDSAEKDRDKVLDDAVEVLVSDSLKNSKVSPLIGTDRYYNALEVPKGKPTPEGEAEYLNSITEDYEWNVNIGETVFFNTGSMNFNNQFQKAASYYVQLESGEFPIILYDKTIKCNAKFGFIVSNRYLHVHTKDIIPYKIKLARISTVVVEFGETTKDWSRIMVKQKNSKKLYPVFKSVNAERVIEVADVIIKMIYHLVPGTKARINIKGIMPYEEKNDDDTDNKVIKKIKKLFKVREKSVDRAATIWAPRYAKKDITKKNKTEGSDIKQDENSKDKNNKKEKKAKKKGKK